MKSPLVHGTMLTDWTIIHESGDVLLGRRRVAFTTPLAFDAWAQGDIHVPRDAWMWGPPKSVLNMEATLLTPNRRSLLLSEAWGWKFPGECPQMSSAKDGQEVLGELLGGDFSPAHKSCWKSWWLRGFYHDQVTPEALFIAASKERAEMNVVVRLEQFSPDAVVGPEGELVLLKGVDCEFFSLVGKDTYLTARQCGGRIVVNGSLQPGEELMVINDSPAHDALWTSQVTMRDAPTYVDALA